MESVALLGGVAIVAILGLMCIIASELSRSTRRDSFELNINDRLLALEATVDTYGKHARTEQFAIPSATTPIHVPEERYTPPNWNIPVPLHHFDSR